MIVINTGATANDGTGDKLRDAFIIVNENFSNIQSILDNVLTGTSSISISQISGLQTILDDLGYQVSLIPGLQDDINSINSTIFTINQTLNSQNSSISELYSLVNDLQQQIYTKIGEAPIDGKTYGRKDANWVEVINDKNRLPDDFYMAGMIDIGDITYLTDTYRRLDLNTIVTGLTATASVSNTNVVIRDGDDIYLFSNGYSFSGSPEYPDQPVLIIKFKNCYIENNLFKYENVTWKEFTGTMRRIHTAQIHRGFIFASSRNQTGLNSKLYRICASNFNDVKEIEFTGFLGQTWSISRVQMYKENAYVLISSSSSNPQMMKVDFNLTSYTNIINYPTTAAKRILFSTPFILANGEIIFCNRSNQTPGAQTTLGVSIFDIETGILKREVTNIVIKSSNDGIVIQPHWLSIFGGKIIITDNRSLFVIRFDYTTLSLEEVVKLNSKITNDNTIFSNGYIYLNGEGGIGSSDQANLYKIYYNDFTDLSVEIAYPNWDYGSSGSIEHSLDIDVLNQFNLKYISEAPINGNSYVRKDGEWSVVSGVTFSQLLENVTPDSYLGLRLQPASASNNGFYINKSTNQSVGYYTRNTDNVGNAAVSALYLGGSGGLYDNYVSLFHANAGYSIPYLRNNNGLISNNDLFFIGWQGASFDFVTSTGTFGSETSKFRITNSGTVSIGVTPSLDNTTTDILGRKADGTIVRIDKSSIVPVLSLDELTDVEITSPTNNQIPAYESATNLWKNKSLEELGSTTNLISDGIAGTAVTGSTNQTRILVKSYLIPANTFEVGDIMEFWAFGSKVGSATAWYVGCSKNTSNTLSGSTELVRSYSNNAGIIYLPLQRVVNFPTASTLKVSSQTNTGE